MSSLESIGRMLVGVGIALILSGALIWLLARAGFLGRLPGDIRIERDGITCLIPVVSSIVLSVLFTVLLNIVIWLINR